MIIFEEVKIQQCLVVKEKKRKIVQKENKVIELSFPPTTISQKTVSSTF